MARLIYQDVDSGKQYYYDPDADQYVEIGPESSNDEPDDVDVEKDNQDSQDSGEEPAGTSNNYGASPENTTSKPKPQGGDSKINVPEIGDRGSADIQQKEQEEREKEIERDGEWENDTPSNKSINDLMDDPDLMQGLEKEVADNKRKARELAKQAKRARQNAKTANSPLRRFKISLDKFIKGLEDQEREDTYRRTNKNYNGTPFILKGHQNVIKANKPNIYVFFDRSGSWDDTTTAKGKQAIALLDKAKKQDKLDYTLFYFSDEIFTEKELGGPLDQCGTSAGPKISALIKAEHPDNVIILTDGDIGRFPPVEVSGAVWMLFVNYQSDAVKKGLKGKSQTKIYDLTGAI